MREGDLHLLLIFGCSITTCFCLTSARLDLKSAHKRNTERMEQQNGVYTPSPLLNLWNAISHSFIKFIWLQEKLYFFPPLLLPFSKSKTEECTKCSREENMFYEFQERNSGLEHGQGCFRASWSSQPLDLQLSPHRLGYSLSSEALAQFTNVSKSRH